MAEDHKGISPDVSKMFEEMAGKSPVPNKDRSGSGKSKPERRNGNDYVFKIDLHGMSVDECLANVLTALRKGKSGRIAKMELITGSGKHSPGVYSPLVLAVQDFLTGHAREFGYSFVKKEGFFELWYSG